MRAELIPVKAVKQCLTQHKPSVSTTIAHKMKINIDGSVTRLETVMYKFPV